MPVLNEEIFTDSVVLSKVTRHRAWVEIDHFCLKNNIQQLKSILKPQTQLMAVVKADAYGHGAVKVAHTLLQAGCSNLATATLEEGIQLRQGGISSLILILGATNTPEELEAIAAWHLQPTLCNRQQALIFHETLKRLGVTLPVHLKIDTGMSRLGTLWFEATEFVELVTQLPTLKIASVYSHLATADDPDSRVMTLQHQRFQQVIADLKAQGINPPCLHLANSAGTLAESSLHYDLVRVGLACYGLYPATHLEKAVQLQPVMSVKARVTQVKTIPPNTGVSYGYQYQTESDLPIAVVGIGYADGIPRNLSGRLQVILRGQLVPQIGAITMDQIMLDVSSIPDLQPGEIVTLIGTDGDQQITALDWAKALNTISWEILCSFKHRLPRVSVNEQYVLRSQQRLKASPDS